VTLLFVLGLAAAEPPAVHHRASRPCIDHRFPMVIGDVVVVCDDMRRASLVMDLETGVVKDRTHQHALPKLSGQRPIARAGTVTAGTPAGTAWVTQGPQDDADIWWAPSDGSPPRPLDVGPGDQHHPIASNDWLAWVSFSDIKLWNTATGERRKIAADTGFYSPPALHNDLVCWEVRGDADLDIDCSNGQSVRRVGHQTRPQLLSGHLLFREKGLLMSVPVREER